MPLSDHLSPAPRAVRMAGVLAAIPGFLLLALAILLLVESTGPTQLEGNIYAEAGFYVVFGAGTIASATGLLLGKTWARSPVVVIALILIGVGWYATGPSGRPGFGLPVIVAGVAIMVLLFGKDSRAWALGQLPGESEEDAARRGGAEGRRTARERDEGGEGAG